MMIKIGGVLFDGIVDMRILQNINHTRFIRGGRKKEFAEAIMTFELHSTKTFRKPEKFSFNMLPSNISCGITSKIMFRPL